MLCFTGHTAFGLSFVVLICACAITIHSDYYKDNVGILRRLQILCVISMALISFQLCVAGYRFQTYFDEGHRFAIITCINFIVALVTLIYSLICSSVILCKTNERTPLRNQSTV